MVEGEWRIMFSSSVVEERKEEGGERKEVVMSVKCGGGSFSVLRVPFCPSYTTALLTSEPIGTTFR
jgi:hypothetical protein